ncbi:MAG: hypothetical protein ACOX3A_07210 [bacterium]|jgi:hypothetical protein
MDPRLHKKLILFVHGFFAILLVVSLCVTESHISLPALSFSYSCSSASGAANGVYQPEVGEVRHQVFSYVQTISNKSKWPLNRVTVNVPLPDSVKGEGN